MRRGRSGDPNPLPDPAPACLCEHSLAQLAKDELHLHTSAPDFRRDADKNKIFHKAKKKKTMQWGGDVNKLAPLFT